MRFLEILIAAVILIVIVSRLVTSLKKRKAFTYLTFAAGILKDAFREIINDPH